QRMYVSMPNLILLLLGFWIFMVFGAAAETILVVIDLGKLCVVGVVLASTLAGVCIMRTPRRHRTVVAITEICMTALLFAFPLAYSLNWACSGPERHYSIQNIECRMQTNKSGSTASYWLTTTVEGGDEKEFHVEEYLYMAAQNGEPLTVCQRTGLFGIRMAEIHK
ncbi:MAG: hypothetical protein DBX97_04160, partial [Collinsella tanakaei]